MLAGVHGVAQGLLLVPQWFESGSACACAAAQHISQAALEMSRVHTPLVAESIEFQSRLRRSACSGLSIMYLCASTVQPLDVARSQTKQKRHCSF